MVEFKSNNGRKGVERVSRTPTGYKMFVFNAANPETHTLDTDGAEMILGRGVEEDGRPFIEIEFVDVKRDPAEDILKSLVIEACSQRNLKIKEAVSGKSEKNLCFHIAHNRLTDVFDALLIITIPTGQPLIPDAGRAFVAEQQQVRHSLEQSLLNAFGQDMYARTVPSQRANTDANTIPKSEINRIARLVEYFRNGVPEMKDLSGTTA